MHERNGFGWGFKRQFSGGCLLVVLQMFYAEFEVFFEIFQKCFMTTKAKQKIS